MRCHICNSVLVKPEFNRDFGDIDPCPKCLEVIADVFTDPVPEEDLRDVEPTLEELMEAVYYEAE